MNKKRIILASLIVALVATEPIAIVVAAQPSREKIEEANSAFKTFKNDMRCMFSRTKKCSPEQKRRIKKQALVLISTLIVLGLSTAGRLYLLKTNTKKIPDWELVAQSLEKQRINLVNKLEKGSNLKRWKSRDIEKLLIDQYLVFENPDMLQKFLNLFENITDSEMKKMLDTATYESPDVLTFGSPHGGGGLLMEWANKANNITLQARLKALGYDFSQKYANDLRAIKK